MAQPRGSHIEALPSVTVGSTVYTATVEISCPPFTELTIRADGHPVQTQTCPDRQWALRAYESFLHQVRTG